MSEESQLELLKDVVNDIIRDYGVINYNNHKFLNFNTLDRRELKLEDVGLITFPPKGSSIKKKNR